MLRFRASLTGIPRTVMLPLAAGKNLITALNRVYLSARFTPTSAVIVPVAISNVALEIADQIAERAFACSQPTLPLGDSEDANGRKCFKRTSKYWHDVVLILVFYKCP